MTLTLYNTLTRRKEPFKPIDPTNVRMYVCGPTVYDLAHIGNARPIIVFDVLFRLLRHLAAKGEWDGGKGETKVTYARNITDVDDKINARAVERFPELDPIVAIRKLTEETTAQFHKDIAALGVLMPEDVNKPGEPQRFIEPRATDHIEGMRKLCDMLVANGHAYVAEEHVLFSVESMPDYGKLARRSLDEMEAGARVDVAPYKRGPMDFVLWKPSKPGEPAWPSPGGIATPGRPGWHIECSAMAEKHLGQVFDIHGGGIDLVFPHHENEIAQSRCAHGTAVMANVWMHNGFLQVEGEKMSKSLGNFVTIKELFDGWRGYRWPGQVVRLATLATHYRQPIDFSQDALEQASIALSGFKTWAFSIPGASPSREFMDALLDDLNTPRAITELHRLSHLAQRGVHEQSDRMTKPGAMLSELAESPAAQLAASLQLIGLDMDTYDRQWVQNQAQQSISDEFRAQVERLRDARLVARKAKNWKESDRIRDELAAMGIQLKDVKDPATGEIKTEWEVKR